VAAVFSHIQKGHGDLFTRGIRGDVLRRGGVNVEVRKGHKNGEDAVHERAVTAPVAATVRCDLFEQVQASAHELQLVVKPLLVVTRPPKVVVSVSVLEGMNGLGD
jgi:hypothetical protein